MQPSSSASWPQRAMAEEEEEGAPEEPLPAKLHNTGSLPAVEETQVLVNAYQMNVAKAVECVYKYELKFLKTVETTKTERDGTKTLARVNKDLSQGPRGDVGMQQKRRCLWQCCLLMLRDNAELFGANPREHCYDCGINFYSLRELTLSAMTDEHGQERRVGVFQINHEHLPEEQQAYLGRNVRAVRAQLTAVKPIHPRELDLKDHSVSQFLDILSNQEITAQDKSLFFPSKIFDRESVIRLDRDSRILKEGMQKNVRYVGDDEQSAVPVMQIDPKKSAFFPEMPLLDFLDSMFTGRGGLDQRIRDNFRAATKQVKGLTVITTHMPRNRTFPLFGLSDKSPREMRFEKDGVEISVLEYYERQYQPLRLRHPNLPCAVERRGGGGQGGHSDSFYPLEVLNILPGQRVPRDKQTPQLTEQMIRKCQALPADFAHNNDEAKAKAKISSSNTYFKSHGVRIESELSRANANVLFPPAIHYREDGRDKDEADQRGVLDWRLRGRTYLVPAQAPPKWAAVIFCNEVSGQNCLQFLNAIADSARNRGLNLGKPETYDLNDKMFAGVRERFGGFHADGIKFVMFFTADKLDSVHHTVKQMEIEFPGMVTQHVSRQTMEKALGPKGAQMVIDNILLKFNLKLGGVNFGLSTCGAFSQRMRQSTSRGDIVKDQWLQPGRMFFGLDMSHASPQSLFDRQSGVQVSEPTVVGCAYTVGPHVLKMRGTYWYQESRVTHIDKGVLAGQARVALNNYREQTGDFPHHVFVFRGGVSEGEFQAVLVHEKEAFKAALAELGLARKTRLTIIVIQRQSNYRIVPGGKIDPHARPPEQNVRPGTVVDRKVMHPSMTEFLMVGHKAIQGTARPIRCTAVYDDTEPRVPLEEIENISYALCYAHGIVLSPVSVPAPLYSAAELAKRGRNNWKVRKEEEEDRGSRSSGRFQLLPDQEAQHFFLNMSAQMEPTASTKFWA